MSTYQHPTEILQNLIRFDTTNPPGNEAACVAYIRDLIEEGGIQTQLFALNPDRPNLVARLPGQGEVPPLLLYGHVDVVTTANQVWQRPPFAGEIVEGFIWGRGALDMKSGVTMMVSAILRAKAERVALPGDIVLAVLVDEENSGVFGAKYMVENHMAEKQLCAVKATLRGPGGHGSLPMRGGATAKLAALLDILNRKRLPVHITSVVRQMIETISQSLSFPSGTILRQLLNPSMTNHILDLLGEQGKVFEPLLRHTVNPTIIQGGEKINVIPSEISVGMDGRLLPGFGPDDMLRELRQLVGDLAELEILFYEPGPSTSNTELFDTLAGILREADPLGIPLPLLLSAVTDGRFFSRLGIQTYGFTPMNLPESFNFSATIHAADERIPVEALTFGSNAIFRALQRFG